MPPPTSPHSFAILIVEESRARLTRFRVEVRGETQWATGPEGLVRRLAAAPPCLVAVVGEPQTAIAMADALRQQKLVEAAFIVTPANGVATPRQIPMALPEGVRGLSGEQLLPHLVEAILRWYARMPVSPLTGMPGSSMLRDEIDRRIASARTLALLYIDIDSFKPFNDIYGFGQGDLAIRMLGELTLEAARQAGTPQDLCVHIGGDDFAIVTESGHGEPVARLIVEQFRERARSFYTPEDREKGNLTTKDRRGNVTEYRLMAVSVGGVDTRRRHLTEYLRLAEAATEMKAYAKSLGGDRAEFDRRRD